MAVTEERQWLLQEWFSAHIYPLKSQEWKGWNEK